MDITEKEKHTIAFYDQNAEKWAASHGPEKESFWIEELKLFKKYVPQGKILEIGVGGGREAAQLIKMGYEYVGIDPAGGLIKIAQERFPNAMFIKKSIYDFDFHPILFDGFWCAAVLLHIPRHNIDKALKKIKNAMHTGAIGFISLAQGNGEYFDNESGRWFYLYESDDFAHILQANGFVVEKQAIRTFNTNRTWLQSWVTFFVRT